MKNLTKIILCIFALIYFSSCEPEDIPGNPEEKISQNIDKIGETGDQSGDIDDKK
jgi:hypothetical protein